MTGTKEVTRDSEEDMDNMVGGDLNSSEKTRLMDKAKNNTAKCQVTDVEVMEVRCTKSKRDRYTIDVHHPGGSSKINLRDAFPADKAEEFMNQYEMGSKAYMTAFVMEYAGEERTFVADITTDYDEAVDTRKEVESYRDQYDQVKFKFRDGTQKIRFGEEHKYRYYLPSQFDSDALEVDRENKTAVSIFAFIYVFGSIGFFSSAPLLILMGMLSYVFGIIVAYFGYKISQSTYTVETFDMNPRMLSRDFSEDVEVQKLNIVTTDNYVRLNKPDEDVSWTLEKGEFGDLKERGKKLLRAGKKDGNNLFIPVSDPDSVRRGIRSDNDEYIVPIFNDN